MGAKLDASEMPYWPAAMTQQMAAAYCGLSVDTFASVCPVLPIAITSSKTGQRYLRLRLDEWLMSLDRNEPPKRIGMGALRTARKERNERSRARVKGPTAPKTGRWILSNWIQKVGRN